MTKQDYRCVISTPVSAAEAYDKIARVSEWWAVDFEGSAENLGDVFTVRFGATSGETFVDFKITDTVPGARVVWHVTDSYLPWLQDKTEWSGTDVVFEVSAGGGETTVTMTHEGLVPEVECFDRCVQGWNHYFGESLRQFLTDGRGMPKCRDRAAGEGSLMIQDSIERRITIRAPKERVYRAITDPEQIVSWFPDTINGTLEVGATPTIGFGKDAVYRIQVVAADPHEYFAYRWVPGNTDGTSGFTGDVLTVPNTLVEFRLADDPDGTALTLTESGFSTLPRVVAQKKYDENGGGWDHMLGRLGRLFPQA